MTATITLVPGISFPLTTVFTPPPDCTGTAAYAAIQWANNQIAYQLGSGAYAPSCYPSRFKSLQYETSGWYSPGVCPTEYEYVATSTASIASGAVATFAVCCPSGMHFWGTEYSCYQVVTEGGDLRFSQTADGATAFGNPLSVAWQEKDLDSFTPASAPLVALSSAGIKFSASSKATKSTAAAAGTNTGGQSATQITGGGGTPATSITGTIGASPSASTNQKSGLSTAAAAGIGVGATIAGLALTAGIWWVAKTWKISRREQYATQEKPEAVSNHDRLERIVEAPDGIMKHEADGRSVRAELEGGWQPFELAGMRSPK